MEIKYLHSIITAIVFLSVFLLPTACDRNAHEGELSLPEGKGGVVVDLQTEGGTDLPTDNIHLFFFGTDDRLAEHRYYDDPEKMALDVIHLPAGSYTVVSVLNTGADFMPPSIRATRADLPSVTLSDFADWLKTVADSYPDMLTGLARVQTETGDIERIVITLKAGTEGVRLPVLRLLLTLSGGEMPEYKPQAKSRASETAYTLRCVAELYIKGTDKLALHRAVNPVQQTDGAYLIELSATAGEYDLCLWTDYADSNNSIADTYYHTESLKAVKINAEPYTANTDAKDAAYHTQTGINLAETGAEIKAALQRPLAKYRLVATDVEAYRKLVTQNQAKYPPLDELTVAVRYEGYFPCGFNVASEKPNDATAGTGIFYSQSLPATGSDDDEVQVAADWVLVNGTESFVSATVRTTDRSGRVISETSGVRIDYRRGFLTTVRGNFLTVGHTGGGIEIDTEWEGTYEVIF